MASRKSSSKQPDDSKGDMDADMLFDAPKQSKSWSKGRGAAEKGLRCALVAEILRPNREMASRKAISACTSPRGMALLL